MTAGAGVELLASGIDVAELSAWITAIDFAEWPQQHRVDAQLRPAMVTDGEWRGFGERATPIVEKLLMRFPPTAQAFNWMLSVVMPGHSIAPHVDAQGPTWIGRVHVPLTSNASAVMVVAGEPRCLDVGSAYLVDIRIEHAIYNDGATPRIHFMFDVRTA
jgi:hypothetical protein